MCRAKLKGIVSARGCIDLGSCSQCVGENDFAGCEPPTCGAGGIIRAPHLVDKILSPARCSSVLLFPRWLNSLAFDKEASAAAKAMWLEVLALSTFTRTYTQRPALILGFAGCNREELHRGVALLQKALRVGPKSLI